MSQNNQLLISAQAPTISQAVTNAASTSVNLPARGETVRIVNEPGGSTAYVSIGIGSQTATVPATTAATTCTPVLSGSDVALRIASDQVLQMSAITSAGTATLRVTVSEGS